jgi:hypothetical protein
VDVGRVEVGPALGEPAEDVVGDAVAVVLAVTDVGGELRMLRVLVEQLPE